MKRVAAALRRQPVRAYLYGLLAPGIGVAGAYGLVTEAKGALWIALGAAVLLPFGVEAARSKVTPVAKPRNNAGQRLVPLRTGSAVRITPLDDQGRPSGPAREMGPGVMRFDIDRGYPPQ